MPDFLAKFLADAKKRVGTGYYSIPTSIEHKPQSLKRALSSAEGNAVIAEIKPISPARGLLRAEIDPENAAVMMERGGAVALSVLTEPDNFGGSLENLRKVRERVRIPLLMKDIVIDVAQIHAARACGADSVLLIESAFSKHHAGQLEDYVQFAHDRNLEVLLEVHNERELRRAIRTDADVIGVNNRNLATLEIDLDTTTRLLGKTTAHSDRMIISESGIETSADILKLKHVVNGFLIGTSLMLSEDVESKVREFVLA